MSLITYEFKRADNAGEISQFRATLPIMQNHYQGRNEVTLYLSGKLNINGVDIDGLIIKEDAIVLVEFKNYAGKIKAQANGDWFHNDERINGGANKKDGTSKTVFEQLKINRRALRDGLSRFTKNTNACSNIQALVVFSKITSLHLDEEFNWGANSWVNVTDIEHIGEELDTIKAKNYKNVPVAISKNDIFDFIRNKELDERYILMKYSDVHILPSDLYHEDETHNGDDFSPNTLLAKVTAEKEKYEDSLHDAVVLIESVMQKMEVMAKEKDVIIQQQKAELLQIKAEQLTERKLQMEAFELASEEDCLLQEAKTIEAEVLIIDEAPTQLDETKVSIPKKRFGMKEKVLKEFNVETNSMDDDQLDLIDKTLNRSMIVAGCAGSGKSIIAMHKAQQILDDGGDVILIAYTKSLNRYMSQGKNNSLDKRFYYHWQWRHCGCPNADYVIVDEIQDFDKEEILQFIMAAKKSFFFFGDTAQSIYTAFGKQTMTIDEIANLTSINVSRLYNNYRLPKPIAKITQEYLGLSEKRDAVREFSESLYLSKERALPIFVECDSKASQIERMILIIQSKKYRNVGILVPENDMVLEIVKAFTAANFACEFKYNANYDDSNNKDTLDFRTQHPKLMTFHSAKGLQFETIILPYYNGAKTIDEQKALYVAMTRTYRYLYVLYSDALAAPLNTVPERLFTKE